MVSPEFRLPPPQSVAERSRTLRKRQPYTAKAALA